MGCVDLRVWGDNGGRQALWDILNCHRRSHLTLANPQKVRNEANLVSTQTSFSLDVESSVPEPAG